jgi:adenylate kinase family enzyme
LASSFFRLSQVDRISGRREDPVTKISYHLKTNPPPNDPEILKRLTQRQGLSPFSLTSQSPLPLLSLFLLLTFCDFLDDTESTLRTRLKNYHDQISSVISFFPDAVVKVCVYHSRLLCFCSLNSLFLCCFLPFPSSQIDGTQPISKVSEAIAKIL